MEYLFPVIALFLLGLLVVSGSGMIAYLNEEIHFVGVILPMVAFGVIFSILTKTTSLLPAIITMSTLLSLLGIWTVKAFRSTKDLPKDINKQIQ
jgi:hypothetical protein